jgi:hypothetical protein
MRFIIINKKEMSKERNDIQRIINPEDKSFLAILRARRLPARGLVRRIAVSREASDDDDHDEGIAAAISEEGRSSDGASKTAEN